MVQHIGDMRQLIDDIILHHLSHLFEMPMVRAHLHHHTALRWYGVNCTACVSPLRGDDNAQLKEWNGANCVT